MAVNSTRAKHQAIGYQNAMLDIARALNSADPQRVAEWVANNLTSAEHRAALAAQPRFEEEM